MPRAKTKEELLKDASEGYEKLMTLVNSFTEQEQDGVFSFADRDRNIRDVLAHLYEWQRMMERWYKEGVVEGVKPDIPRKGYTWKTTADMNLMIWKDYQDTRLDDIKKLLAKSHEQMLTLIKERSNEELYTKAYYPFTTSTLGSFFVSSTASHYEWAMKKIKKYKKELS